MDIKLEKENIQSHVDKGNYHAGINLAISAMNECRRNKDQAGVDEFIDFIRTIVDRLADEFGSRKN
ncbi:MAG: hypothetical protein KAT12_08325 [Gammaproteobacteria bacterium]|nr:hypothetical protein [Gammaproteobacteria bacterium]